MSFDKLEYLLFNTSENNLCIGEDYYNGAIMSISKSNMALLTIGTDIYSCNMEFKESLLFNLCYKEIDIPREITIIDCSTSDYFGNKEIRSEEFLYSQIKSTVKTKDIASVISCIRNFYAVDYSNARKILIINSIDVLFNNSSELILELIAELNKVANRLDKPWLSTWCIVDDKRITLPKGFEEMFHTKVIWDSFYYKFFDSDFEARINVIEIPDKEKGKTYRDRN